MKKMSRKNEVKENFIKKFKDFPTHFFEGGGRLEIVGNHTDHNHGLCLVAGCSLTIIAAVKENNLNKIRVTSDGFPYIEVNLNELNVDEKLFSTSTALIKGIVKKIKDLNYVVKGFDATLNTTIYPGAGVSSSAAYEVLFASIISKMFNNNAISKLEIAKISQYAENVYFGKPSGLLDQIGASFGGIDYIDFKNVEEPIIKKLNFNLPLHIVLINSKGDHANLTPLYKAIPDQMFALAHRYGKNYLREVEEKAFIKDITSHSDIELDEIKKGLHFFGENKRVEEARKAIENNDVDLFLDTINKSGESSKLNLNNTMAYKIYENSPQKAIDTASKYLKNGAVRIHGGGFAGTIIAFVRNEEFTYFMENMILEYGKENVQEVNIRKKGVSLI